MQFDLPNVMLLHCRAWRSAARGACRLQQVLGGGSRPAATRLSATLGGGVAAAERP
ncbi:MAG: hypothetical protein H8E73_03340 [Planctomycetes bacterium]|nr:hypothetical protein [Planctomycetota bacterium]